MAGEAEQDFLAAQGAAMFDYEAGGVVDEGGAENTDSDDEYDPSATMQEDSSVPLDRSEQISTANLRDSPVSPSNSSLHPLPPRPFSGSSTFAPDPHGTNRTSSPTVAALPQPKMRAGFEVDDDDDLEAEEENDDSRDILDVYDPVEGTDGDFATSAPVPELPIDRVSQTSVQPNGAAVPALPKDTVIDALGVVHSPALSSTAILPQRATTVTPVQVAAYAQIQAAPMHTNVITSLASAVPKARLAHDVIGILEDRIKDDPRGDLPAWLELIDELKSRNKQDEVRRLYDRFLQVFPIAAEQWCSYVRWEEEHDRKYEMEKLFQRSLLEVPDVQLWTIYINYIRRRNSMQTGDIAKSYKIIYDSFTFALTNVGMDKDSGKLWQDYLDFIKSGPGVIGGNGWQDTQKMDSLRAAYQKAICVPTSTLNSLWKEYDGFETGLSKINGRKFLQERSPAYMTARSSFTQLQNMTKDLNRTSRPRLPPGAGFDGDVEYAQQVEIWKQWIQWEKDDNLVLKDEDPTAYRNRILFTYKQALMALQFWPEMWYDAAEFCFSAGLDAEGLKFLTQGIAANPESCLLAFKHADRIELGTTNDDSSDPGAKQRMKKVRDPYDKVLDALYNLITKTKARETQEVQRIELNISDENADPDMIKSSAVDEYNTMNEDAKKQAAQGQIDFVKHNAHAQIELLRKTISFAWVALMRAARRIQGKGLPTERGGGFRLIFGDARKKGKLTSDVYVESALIEYHCYKDPAGTKIFERGMKLFPEDEKFALEYLKHLIAINDITNARAVFETTVGKLTTNPTTLDRAKPIFLFLHEYESHFGELSQVTRLEKRMSDLYPHDLGLRQFAKRFTSATFDPTVINPIISMQQMQPKVFLQPSVETHNHVTNSPISKLIDSINTNSPKRPFPLEDFDDMQPRKMARGESPLKGAAGRRINQQQRQANGHPPPMSQIHVPIPPPLPDQLISLLRILPNASTYVDTKFDPRKMVELIRDIHLPPSVTLRQTGHQSTPHPPAWQQSYPSQQQPPMMPAGYMPVPGMAQSQYSGSFRYA